MTPRWRLPFEVVDAGSRGRCSSPAVSALSLAAGLLAASLSLAAFGGDPVGVPAAILRGSLGSLYGWGETIAKAIPLTLAGIGVALALSGRLWNIGAEGQILLGAVFASGLALRLGAILPAWAMVPAVFAAGFAGGALLAAAAGVLRVRFGVNEVIGTLMLNYVCAEFVQYLVYGPWKGPSQFGFPYTDHFADSCVLPCLASSRVHLPTLALAAAAAPASAWLLGRTRFGFQARALGGNPDAAALAGIDSARVSLRLMALSGGLAGLAGAGEIAGVHHRLGYPWSLSSGYGFCAILVAWLAGLDPLWVPLSALLMGAVLVGGDAIQTEMNLPASAVSLFNGVLLLSFACGGFFLRHRLRRRRA